MLGASRGYLDVKRRRMFGNLRNRHSVYRAPWYLLKVEAVQQTSYSDPDIHLAYFPSDAHSTA